MHKVAKHWDVAVSVALGVTAALFLAPDRWTSAAAELVAFFAIQSAAAYFAMTITASGVRPEALSISDLDRYDSALKELMLFWKVFLGLSVSAAALLATTKLVGWPNANETAVAGSVKLQHIASGILATIASLALLRTVGFFRDVSTLMRINRDLAQHSISRRDARTADDFSEAAQAEPFVPPAGYGRQIQDPY